MIERSGIIIFRFHDYAHETEPDFIHEGFIRALNLKIAKKYPRETLAVCRYELEEETTVLDMAKLIAEKTEVKSPRIVGGRNNRVKTGFVSDSAGSA